MRRAIELAGQGFPAPNPRVGAVIVSAGEVLGEGYHDHRGGPHAEVVALRHAREAGASRIARSTLYVTLEPCNHHGRTPPCSEAVIAAEIQRVVIAQRDPNPKAAGGIAALKHAGVEVEVGLLADEARRQNELFHHRYETGRPFVVLKAGITLDGMIAPEPKRTIAITSDEARAHSRLLRAEMGAVLVGWNTVAIDNPELTARDGRVVNEPLRVIVDPDGKLTGAERIFHQPGETVCWVREPQHEFQTLQPDFAPAALVAALGERGMLGVLVEGGAGTLARFLAAECFDRIDLYVAPKILGRGLAWNGGAHTQRRLRIMHEQPIGNDRYLQLRPE